MTDNIYFIPQYIPCSQCNRKLNAHDVVTIAMQSKDKEYICECGNAMKLEVIGKYFAMIKDVKI